MAALESRIKALERARAQPLPLYALTLTGGERRTVDALEAVLHTEIPRVVCDWRDCPADFVKHRGTSYGYEVIKPDILTAAAGRLYFMLHNVAECILVQSLCPGFKSTPAQAEMFLQAVRAIDFANAYTDYPVTYSAAYFALKKQQL